MSYAWPSSLSYTLGSLAAWVLFLCGIGFLAWASDRSGFPRGLLWGVAVSLTVSVAIQFVAAYRLIARQDEFVRALTAKRMVAAGGLIITAAVLWGIAQQFLGAPGGPLWLIYPAFWGAVGMVTPFIRSSRP